MASVRFVPDRAGIAAVLYGRSGPVVRFVRETTRKVRTQAVLRCPVDTGNLRAAHREELVISGTQVQGQVVNDIEYAQAVHEGTGPRTIRPRRPGGVLRFTVGAEVVFASYARHPGTPAQPWLFEALQAVARPAGFTIYRT